MLVAQGVLEVRRGKGTFVSDRVEDIDDFGFTGLRPGEGPAADLFELRSIFEPQAARLACRRATAEERADILAKGRAVEVCIRFRCRPHPGRRRLSRRHCPGHPQRVYGAPPPLSSSGRWPRRWRPGTTPSGWRRTPCGTTRCCWSFSPVGTRRVHSTPWPSTCATPWTRWAWASVRTECPEFLFRSRHLSNGGTIQDRKRLCSLFAYKEGRQFSLVEAAGPFLCHSI